MQLVDQAGPERLGRQGGAADAQVGGGGILQIANRRGVELALQTSPWRRRGVE
jgi:hypothetical protein